MEKLLSDGTITISEHEVLAECCRNIEKYLKEKDEFVEAEVTNMVKKINEEEFRNEALRGLAVVDFSANWCGPCKMMAPVLEEISEEMEHVNFYNVDVDEETKLAIEYGISSIPAILVLKDGVTRDILVGFKPKIVLEKEISDLL